MLFLHFIGKLYVRIPQPVRFFWCLYQCGIFSFGGNGSKLVMGAGGGDGGDILHQYNSVGFF